MYALKGMPDLKVKPQSYLLDAPAVWAIKFEESIGMGPVTGLSSMDLTVMLWLLLVAAVVVVKDCCADQAIARRFKETTCTGSRMESRLVGLALTLFSLLHAATVGVVTETNAEKAIEELKAYEVRSRQSLHNLGSQSAIAAASQVGDVGGSKGKI